MSKSLGKLTGIKIIWWFGMTVAQKLINIDLEPVTDDSEPVAINSDPVSTDFEPVAMDSDLYIQTRNVLVLT